MNSPGKQDFTMLLKGYLDESLNPDELDHFFILSGQPENSLLIQEHFEKYLESDPVDLSNKAQSAQAWIRLQRKLQPSERPVRTMRPVVRWVAASVILVGAATMIYLFRRPNLPADRTISLSETRAPAWLKPEHIGATLFLGGGDSITLNSQDKGVIATEDGIQVLQSGGGLSYAGKSQRPIYNEIRTGRGKLWQLILPDQTRVWLNGSSSIKYPLQFAPDTRSVVITGEVYFEVTHDVGHPFLVKANRFQVEDLGTSFNIKSFTGDPAQTTTLIEGSVNVKCNHQQATLSPGQQSVVSADKNKIIVVQQANLTEALAWKNGFFYFQQAGLADVMKQLSDWYQVSVVYKGRAGKELFSGQIDKSLPLSEVLQGLQQPGVKFELDSNHQITVIQE